jgi:lipoprotein-anchoring transpeptidase ErfK/SrfK
MTTRSAPLRALVASLVIFTGAAQAARASSAVRLEVSTSERQLYVKVGETITRTYDVAIGTRSHPTPTGSFTLDRVIWNPGWTPPPASKWARGKKPAKPGDPNSPIQVAKIPFLPLYHIHGTDQPDSVGSAASHGCIRMKPEHVAELARTLMEHSGQHRDPDWYGWVLESRRSHQVELGQEIELVIE